MTRTPTTRLPQRSHALRASHQHARAGGSRAKLSDGATRDFDAGAGAGLTRAVVIGGTPGAITAGLNTAASCPPRGAGTAPDHTDPTTEATTRHANATPATTSTSRRPGFAARTRTLGTRTLGARTRGTAPSAPASAPAEDPPAEPAPPTPTLAAPQPVDAQAPPAPKQARQPPAPPSRRASTTTAPPEVVRSDRRRLSNAGPILGPGPLPRDPRTERHQVLARAEPVPGKWTTLAVGSTSSSLLGYSVRRFPPVCRTFLARRQIVRPLERLVYALNWHQFVSIRQK